MMEHYDEASSLPYGTKVKTPTGRIGVVSGYTVREFGVVEVQVRFNDVPNVFESIWYPSTVLEVVNAI